VEKKVFTHFLGEEGLLRGKGLFIRRDRCGGKKEKSPPAENLASIPEVLERRREIVFFL